MQTMARPAVALALVLAVCSTGASAQPPSNPIIVSIIGDGLGEKVVVQTWTLDLAPVARRDSQPRNTLSVERTADSLSQTLVQCFVKGCDLTVSLYSGQSVVTMDEARIVEYRQTGVAGRTVVNTETVVFEGQAQLQRVP
jgi:hypothetical protein